MSISRSRICRRLFAVLFFSCTFGLFWTSSVSAMPFSPAVNYATAGQPFAVATADFNGDGRPDLAAANATATTVSVMLGTGGGLFGPTTNFPVGAQPFDLTTGDFNGDGKADIATANLFSGNVSILPGNGAGGFGAPTTFPAGANARHVISADLNGDGKLDLAVSNSFPNTVSVLLGNGLGGFSAPTAFGTGTSPQKLVAADFNGDGKLDLATANDGSANLSVLLGNGLGGFGAATNFPAGSSPRGIAAGDLNGDGKIDLVATNGFANALAVLFGNGAGSFSAPATFPSGAFPYSVTIGDFDGDGKPDLASGNISGNSASVLLGNGVGGFGAATDYAVGNSPFSIIAADLDGDGSTDLVTSNRSTNNLSVLLNQVLKPDLRLIKSALPANPRPGDLITYTLNLKNIGTANANGSSITDSLPPGVSFDSADAPCVESSGTVSCAIGTLAPGAEVSPQIRVRVLPWGAANASATHRLDVQKVEAQVDLEAGQLKTVSVSCPSGMAAVDGSVRIDHIDQGAGDWPQARVLASRASPAGTWTGTVLNAATGRAQAKVFAVCLRTTTGSDGGHDHGITITSPITVAASAPAGLLTRTLACGPGQIAVAPGFTTSSAGDLIYSQPDGNGWKFVLDLHGPASVTFEISCLSRQVALAAGHIHDLGFERITNEVTIEAGKVNEAQLTCPDGSKGILAGWDLDHGLLSLGNDPRPVTRAFRIHNPTAGPLKARISLLCIGDLTAGEHAPPVTITNTAQASTTTAELTTLNNISSASVTAEDTDTHTPVTVDPTPDKPAPNNPVGSTRYSSTVTFGPSGLILAFSCESSCNSRVRLVTSRPSRVGPRRHPTGTLLAQGRLRAAAGKHRLSLRLSPVGRKLIRNGLRRAILKTPNGSRKVTISRRTAP